MRSSLDELSLQSVEGNVTRAPCQPTARLDVMAAMQPDIDAIRRVREARAGS